MLARYWKSSHDPADDRLYAAEFMAAYYQGAVQSALAKLAVPDVDGAVAVLVRAQAKQREMKEDDCAAS